MLPFLLVFLLHTCCRTGLQMMDISQTSCLPGMQLKPELHTGHFSNDTTCPLGSVLSQGDYRGPLP